MAADRTHSPNARRAVIQAKVAVPSLPDRMAARPRLSRRIQQLARERGVLVVAASAGSGKTTAVVEALAGLQRPIAWLTVDRPDVAPGRLVTYLEAALARVAPQVEGVAAEALTAGLAHVEVAGLLLNELDDTPRVLVLDELERLGEEADAWAVIDTLVRYAPATLTLVLVSRRTIPPGRCTLPPGETAHLGDRDLAFTPEEAAMALERVGKTGSDAVAAVEGTAGWVTGVLFEAWRSDAGAATLGPGTDPLYGYLASQILADLPPDLADFLVVTSVFDEVTDARTAALGLGDARSRLRRLRLLHLPATWSDDGRTLRCHSFFREYLLEQLELRDEAAVVAVRLNYARQLVQERHDELAVEELLRIGALEEAAATMERVIVPVVERLDLDVAERWLHAVAAVRDQGASHLTIAELMVLIAREDFVGAGRVLDDVTAGDCWAALFDLDERGGYLGLWAALHLVRFADAERILAVIPPGEAHDVVQMAVSALTDVPDAPTDPDLTVSGPLHAMAQIALYCRGRLAQLTAASPVGWLSAMESPWRIAALRAMGQTQTALQLYESGLEQVLGRQTLLLFVGPEAYLDAGRHEEARRAVARARELAAVGGSVAFQTWARIVEAKLALRVDREPHAALHALASEDARRGREALAFLDEVAATWEGYALLQLGRDGEAVALLRRVVGGMEGGGRLLELPTAAVYLAEAEWRVNNEPAADHAADTALAATTQQQSNHLLLQALADFPAVLARRLDAEAGADTPWHAIGLALAPPATVQPTTAEARSELLDIGRRQLVVAGQERRLRIAKSYELIAYLAGRPGGRAPRDDVLEALFGERRDDSARAYLRQAAHWVRQGLGDHALVSDGGALVLDARTAPALESARWEQQLLEAGRLHGEARYEGVVEAIGALERGEWLPGAKGPWAQERTERMARLLADHRFAAAELAYEFSRFDEGQQLLDRVLRDEPYREAAWRLGMRFGQALGDEASVIRSFRRCEEALAEFGTSPSSSTRRLLEALRR